jgi:phosphatidylinositol dimannoside acyltransferase
MLQRTRERAIDLGYAAGWGLVKAVPSPLTKRGFAAAADAASVRNGAGTRQLRKNLRRVVGPDWSEEQLDHLVGESLRSYARYWLETFRLPKMDHAKVIASVDANVRGLEYVDAARELGLGAIMALPHMGNWDACGLWFVHRDGPFTTVAERLKPESLYDRFVAYREGLGFEVLPLTGGPRPPVEVLKERLLANRNICLVADRDLSRNGIEVQFFGEATRMPGGPAVLAATTGAPLITAAPYFVEDGWGVDFSPPLVVPEGRLRDQVAALTQGMADNFAQQIAAHPADWHMLQRLWLADLPPREPKPIEMTG